MISTWLSALLVPVAYLIGAIPFGYLTAKWLRGIDIRMVGSGNTGATNVGRVMGFRFFVLVFLLDAAKGLLPTLGFPLLVKTLTGEPAPPELAVFVAIATILGHNFPIYLNFKGGKGVATSLGAVFALDPFAGGAAFFGFLVFLLITRYVSLSSILGGLVFFLAHFMRVRLPWSREHLAMSLMTIALLALLFYRHRKNFARISAGTEPMVSLRKKRKEPSGRVAVSWLLLLTVVAALGIGGTALWRRASKRETLAVGSYRLTEVAREGTGHQRAERIAFADSGRLLAVTCPRYNRLVLYRVTDRDSLELLEDVALDGKPVAVCPSADRLYVLERPAGDSRHVEPGWWQAYDLQGKPSGEKVLVGFYPDDMALSADGKLAYVLSSGSAEGDSKKPAPALDVYGLGTGKGVARLTFDGKGDDPARLTMSAAGRCAAVTLSGSNVAAAVDLFDPERPRLIGRSPLSDSEHPYPSRAEDDSIVMPVASGREAVTLSIDGVGECVACTLPQDSGLEVSTTGRRLIGRLPLRGGVFGMSKTRPIGLAFSPERGLIAVANRSGGVHLVAIRPEAVAAGQSRNSVAAAFRR